MRGSLAANRLLTLLLFLLLVAICAYWALQILAPRPAIAPSASIGDTNAAVNLAPAVTLFGSANAITAGTPEAPSNIQVSGVAESGPNGVVILSVDGKPGAPYGVNESVIEGTTVKSVTLDKVVLNQRGRLIELKTPERASRDVLSSAQGKPRTGSESSTTAPVSTRAVAPAPLPQPARTPPPQLRPPPPPQQQQIDQQQQMQQQQSQQQQSQQQQAQQQQQANPQYQAGNPLAPAGSQPMQGSGQAGASSPTAVSGEQQVPPPAQQPLLEQPQVPGQLPAQPGQQVVPGQQGNR